MGCAGMIGYGDVAKFIMQRPADVYVYVFAAALLATVGVMAVYLTLGRPEAPAMPPPPNRTLQQVLTEEAVKRGMTPRAATRPAGE